jgi:predicted Fe-S protein YdhL (DUF1289 family)
MAIFPKIQSPCPYKNDLASIMDGDMCRMCKRQVVDLTPMTDQERAAFLQGCEGAVCVSYRIPAGAVLAAAVVAAASAAPLAAAAQSAPDTAKLEMIVVGGIKNPHKVQQVEINTDEARAPRLPVVYEDAPPVQAAQAPARSPAADERTAPPQPAKVTSPAGS